MDFKLASIENQIKVTVITRTEDGRNLVKINLKVEADFSRAC